MERFFYHFNVLVMFVGCCFLAIVLKHSLDFLYDAYFVMGPGNYW